MVKQACTKYDKHHYLKFSTWEGGRLCNFPTLFPLLTSPKLLKDSNRLYIYLEF